MMCISVSGAFYLQCHSLVSTLYALASCAKPAVSCLQHHQSAFTDWKKQISCRLQA